jgi:hypothetical protein
VDLHKLWEFLNRIFWAVARLGKIIKVLASNALRKLQKILTCILMKKSCHVTDKFK